MNFHPPIAHRPGRPGEIAFTMVEVALSLAIVAFAMVAIIGVMPAGLTVQKENREDTVISQDAAFLLEAIRGGYASSNLTALTNSLLQFSGPYYAMPSNTPLEVIKRLSIPRWDTTNATGYVRAHFRALSGNLSEIGAGAPPVSFSYVLTAEVTNYTADPAYASNPALPPGGLAFLTNNLYEVKLTFQWPAYEGPPGVFPTKVGNGRLVVRTLVSGQLVYDFGGYLFRSTTFTGP